MAYVTREEIAKAKELDLLSYLQTYEPDNLVHVGGNTYCTREHDSLKISNGKWHWFSRGIGGRTALDYLVKVRDYPFPQAVETLIGRAAAMPPVSHIPKPEPPRNFEMPPLNSSAEFVNRFPKNTQLYKLMTTKPGEGVFGGETDAEDQDEGRSKGWH